MINKKMAILGANSFLSRNLYKYLLDVAQADPDDIKLYDKDSHHLDGGANYAQIDFFDEDSIGKIDFACDIMYVFIGKTGTVNGFKEYKQFIAINEIVLLNILTVYCAKGCTAKIVYPSSRLIYKGDTGMYVKEDSEKHFKSVYAITKFASEAYLKLYSEMFGLQYCILRICTPYGSLLEDSGNYGTFEIFTNMAKMGNDVTVFGDGQIIKTYTHIEDICSILLQCGQSDLCTNTVLNVGGENLSLQDIGHLIADKFGVKVRNIEWPETDRKVDVGSTILDSTKLDSILHIQYRKIDI
jgi:UDP-glucose 4-epimerase